MTRGPVPRRAALLAVAASLACVGVAAGTSIAKSSKPASPTVGPKGPAFYAPKGKLPNGPHGTLIWARRFSGGPALAGATNYRVLYKQTGIHGTAVVVSGMVSIPNGPAPTAGWPVITWAHGTTGIADQCAPSRMAVYSSDGPDAIPLLTSWVKSGYAVLRTDYEGLGTPGPHPYLIGVSEGRGVLDIVRAARDLDPQLSDRVIISGHSQGGHAALWAASLAKSYTPEVSLRGVIAFAPASHIATEAGFLKSLATTSLTGLAATIFRGLDITYPSLNIGALLTPAATKLYPQTLTKCLGQLDAANSFGGLPLNQLVQPTANLTPAIADLQKNDPGKLKIGAPVLLAQGLADTTVLPPFTQQLSVSLAGVGDKVTLDTYKSATHSTVLGAAKNAAATFLKRRLGAQAR
jgi:pimeloyl-ACP methyl ester carboxylesterase